MSKAKLSATASALTKLFSFSELEMDLIFVGRKAVITGRMSQLLALFLCEGGRLTEEERALIVDMLPDIEVTRKMRSDGPDEGAQIILRY